MRNQNSSKTPQFYVILLRVQPRHLVLSRVCRSPDGGDLAPRAAIFALCTEKLGFILGRIRGRGRLCNPHLDR
jgi:hypothetical protein